MATLPPSDKSGRLDEAMLQPDTGQRSDASRLLGLKQTAMNLPMAAFWLLAGVLVSLCWILLFLAIGCAVSAFFSYSATISAITTNPTSSPRKPQHELDANYYYEPRCLRLVAKSSRAAFSSGRASC